MPEAVQPVAFCMDTRLWQSCAQELPVWSLFVGMFRVCAAADATLPAEEMVLAQWVTAINSLLLNQPIRSNHAGNCGPLICVGTQPTQADGWLGAADTHRSVCSVSLKHGYEAQDGARQ